jgi:hypothetical protein
LTIFSSTRHSWLIALVFGYPSRTFYSGETAMKTRNNRLRIAACVVAVLAVFSPFGRGASKGFNGKWKGEIQLPVPGGGSRGGTPQTRGQQPPAKQFVQRGGGGSRGGGFPSDGIPRGNFGGPQKVTINIRTKDDDTKAVGNITIGETTDDIKDGKIDGDTITFKAGTPSALYEYKGTRDGDQIMMTRTSPAGERGAQTIQFVLKRS